MNLESPSKGLLSGGICDYLGRLIGDLLNWIKGQGWFADTIIVHPTQEMEFLIRNDIITSDKIPIGIVPEKNRGPYFSGRIDGLNLYYTTLVEGFAIIYRKNDIIVKKTMLEINFDDMQHPTKLIVKRLCSSAPSISGVIVKIII